MNHHAAQNHLHGHIGQRLIVRLPRKHEVTSCQFLQLPQNVVSAGRYTTDISNILLGFGASAIGRLPQGYVQNEVGTRAYSQSIAVGRLATVKGYVLTDDDRLRAEIIERIMCDFGADLGRICARHGSAPEAMLRSTPRLQDLISDGIVELDGASLAVTDDSRFLVRSVAAAFDAHLDGSKQLHSRAV
jgi:oxygen-independent coproporphyrinogen-3 oxidase